MNTDRKEGVGKLLAAHRTQVLWREPAASSDHRIACDQHGPYRLAKERSDGQVDAPSGRRLGGVAQVLRRHLVHRWRSGKGVGGTETVVATPRSHAVGVAGAHSDELDGLL